jgi:glucose-1-phosphate cytidylyltransferase
MKTVILAGGLGTRISEETQTKPKPMITIGGMPIIWHIMKIYSSYGINDFIICSGYKNNIIKNYFEEFNSESWEIKIVDTGMNTMTGGRIKQIQKFIGNETFCLSYGDDLKKVEISKLVDFHKKQKRLCTMTITKPQPRFGIVEIDGYRVNDIKEKSKQDEKWINGGYFVLGPEIFDYIKGDATVLENQPLKKLAKMGQLSAFKYNDEYYPMDTLYDKNKLEALWQTGKAYWKIW